MSRGGFGTKVHVVTVGDRKPLACVLTGGNVSDYDGYAPLMDQLPENVTPTQGLIDKGYDSNEIRKDLRNRKIEPVIPYRRNRKEQPDYDKVAYRERNGVERLFGRIKQFRRVATRYEKLAINYRSMICIAILVQCILAPA